jgi:predicted  nucleic acid-binding Zn-ribbon protein
MGRGRRTLGGRDEEGEALKAAPQDQLRLLELQSQDSRLGQLAHREATLPEHVEITTIVANQAQARDAVVVVETDRGDLQREQDKFESDIAQVRQRIQRDQQRMNAGAVSSAKELESLQHEVDSLHRRQADLEEGELEVMERIEILDERLVALRSQVEELSTQLTAAVGRRDEVLAEIAAERADVERQVAELRPQIADDLLALYDKLRTQLGGVAAAALHRRRCEGCRLELNTTDLGRVAAAAADEVVRCEECRRILVRTADSGL